jgi:hypothetical protein
MIDSLSPARILPAKVGAYQQACWQIAQTLCKTKLLCRNLLLNTSQLHIIIQHYQCFIGRSDDLNSTVNSFGTRAFPVNRNYKLAARGAGAVSCSGRSGATQPQSGIAKVV